MAFIGILFIAIFFIAILVIIGWILFVISMILRKKKKKYKLLMAISLVLICIPVILAVAAYLNNISTNYHFNHSVAGAVYEGDIKRAEDLLESGADPDYNEYIMLDDGEIMRNEGNWEEYRPLNYACINNDVVMVELLLRYNAKADRYVWNDALKSESYDVARTLLEKKAYSQEEMEEFLENACYDYNVEAVRILLTYGFDLQEAVVNGMDYLYMNNLYQVYNEAVVSGQADEYEELGEILELLKKHLYK